jgi:RimJ/RimL family protein N-acetyltransferase
MVGKLEFRELEPSDLDIFREIRLESLKKYPDNFTSSYTREKEEPDSFFKKMLKDSLFMGCFSQGGKLLGICGFKPFSEQKKTAHKGMITGFYIRKEYCGRGFAKKLMNKTIEKIEDDFDQVLIRVTRKNTKVHQLYKSCGFKDIGLERRSLKSVDGHFDDEYIMQKLID